LLLTTTIEKAKELGYHAVIIFGHPEYYHRFGFKEASEYSIQTSEGKNMDAFMVLDLTGKGLLEISGRFFESPAFQASEDDLEAFDKRFPFKKKEVKPGQY
jgi:predicted N-acetyltransferase YhbS